MCDSLSARGDWRLEFEFISSFTVFSFGARAAIYAYWTNCVV